MSRHNPTDKYKSLQINIPKNHRDMLYSKVDRREIELEKQKVVVRIPKHLRNKK